MKNVLTARRCTVTRLAAASLLLSLTGCSSSPAEVEREHDAQYVETVQTGSVVLGAMGPAELVAYGRKHCESARAGVPRYVSEFHAQATRGWSPQDVTLLIDTARDVFCPDMQGKPQKVSLNDRPGLRIVAREGEEWVVGDSAHRIEGYYEALLPYLVREQMTTLCDTKASYRAYPLW